MTKALFLDRDGVINIDHGYVHKAEEVTFVPGIFELCRAAVGRGYRLVIVTNQAGIGRGYYTEADFAALMDWMRARFAAEGAPLTAVYHCPYHPEHGVGEYRRESDWRKPGPGMLLAAAAEHGIDLESSILIGDSETDVMAAQAAGVPHRWLLNTEATAASCATASMRALREALAHPLLCAPHAPFDEVPALHR